MILQALNALYSDLLDRGEISRPGWVKTKVGFALCLDSEGNLEEIVPLVKEVIKGGKSYVENRQFELPAAATRTVGISPKFLCDNSSYMLGADNKGKPERAIECHRACAELHKELLGEIQDTVARAIVLFFETWDPSTQFDSPVFANNKEDILNGANLIFRVNGVFAHEAPAIIDAWQSYYEHADGEMIRCLISGEEDVLETVHPLLKGVKDAQSSGAALVSYNALAFCSFGKEQGKNAPVGKKAAFAYTTALNYLLADKDNVQHIGDTTVVCWAKGAEPQYRALSLAALFGAVPPSGMTEDDVRAAVKRLADGLPCPEMDISPETEFYILGISPNAARLSVRFFYRNRFGTLMKNVNDHHEKLSITGSKYEYIPLWALLKETVNKNSKEPPNPVLSGSVAREIFEGALYPAGLLESVMIRIRAERNITYGRAAIIKAYYLRNKNIHCPQEVLTVGLNENSTNIPYTIGRLFAFYEAAQEKANPGINTTIRDKYFNSVAATPAHVLPILNKRYQKHLRKMDPKNQVYFEKKVGELLGIIGETYPARLSLPEQGAFQLGYYHQKQKRYEKKEND